MSRIFDGSLTERFCVTNMYTQVKGMAGPSSKVNPRIELYGKTWNALEMI